MTYSTIQTLTTNSSAATPVAEYSPGDDTSVANAIAERYKANGIDPSRAYDSPDDALQDFGGISGIL